MMRFNTDIYVKSLDEIHYSKAKKSFAKTVSQYSKDNNKLIQNMTAVLCKGYILDILNRDDFSKLLLSYFYSGFNGHDSVIRYMDWLFNTLKNAGSETAFGKDESRSGGYYKYLIQSYTDIKVAHRSKTDLGDEEVLDRLADYTGVVLRLYQILIKTKQNEKSTDYSYPDSINEKTVVHFTNSQFRLDKKGNMTAHDMNDEVKWFNYMLTWQIYCKICQDDGLEES